MTRFEFIFSLFGLLLGFTVVEVLGGLAKALSAAHSRRIGFLTPLLAVFVLMDVASFWSGAWSARALIPASYGALLVILLIAGLYYVAASQIFPEKISETVALDSHYFKRRRLVLVIIWTCNLIAFSIAATLLRQGISTNAMVLIGAYTIFVAVALVSANKWANGFALAALIALYIGDAIVEAAPGIDMAPDTTVSGEK